MVDKLIFPTITDKEKKLPFYITSAGRWDHQLEVVRKKGFSDFQWIYCLGGEGNLHVDGKEYFISEGEGMFLTPHTSHWYYPVSKPWEVCWVSFNGMYVQQLLMNLEFVKSGKVVVTKNNDVEEKVKQIIFLLEANDAFSQFDSSPIFYQLILDLVKLSTFNEDVINQHYNVLRPVFRYLEIHYHQELTLRDIADQLAVTPQHTCLLFQQALGMRPFEYVTKIRIRKAKEKLVKEPDVPISTVAYRVGFQNVSYFIKVFKKHEGQTPAEFRKYHKV